MARTQKRHRRGFGTIRKLKSGKYQARYRNADGDLVSLGTFDTYAEADAALAVVQASMSTGTWHDPRKGERTVGAYIEDLLATMPHLRPRTRSLYQRHFREWIDSPLEAATTRGAPRVIQLGTRTVGSLTPADVREWHSAVHAEATRRATERHRRAQTSNNRINEAIRSWGIDNGFDVSATGRMNRPGFRGGSVSWIRPR